MSITIPASMAKRVLEPPRRRSSTRKKKAHRRAKKTIPLTVVMPAVMSFLVEPEKGWGSPLELAQAGRWNDVGKVLVKGWTGYNVEAGKWDGVPSYLGMVAIGALVHKGANMIGINRIMRNLPAPLNKVSI